MDDQGEDSTDSLESGFRKQGNIRKAQRGFSEMKTELDREGEIGGVLALWNNNIF
ncbi:hypothetical protein NC651_010725 [Populus alba x Populus x berolinensis]|nr:hypothetical protein NC651_010725 [Populus alba x Populus x berolinensis]